MKENKYYTPEIEEFYVGFEYERFIPKSNSTEEECWEKLSMSINYLSLEELDNEIIEKEIRVKYLDKEDIESFGFKHEGGKLIKNYKDYFIYKVDNHKQYNLSYTYPNKILRIDIEDLNMFEESMNYLFQGTIKNKSEFKKLLKQLNII